MESRKNILSDEEILFSSVSKAVLDRYDKDAAFLTFKDRVALSQRQKNRRIEWVFRSAAAVLVAGLCFFFYNSGKATTGMSASDIIVEAPKGSRLKTILPDGSIVWVNSGSRLSYAQSFGARNREVRLSGEAYFEVSRNEKKWFIVSTDNVKVEVLGTKFDIHDYSDDSEAIVSLTEGSVAISHPSRPDEVKYLKPDQRATVSKDSGDIAVEKYKTSDSIQWIDGKLFFDGEALMDIARDLSRSYNVQITISNNSLSSLRFYGNFLRQEQTITEVMDALAATGKINYRQNGRDIMIY